METPRQLDWRLILRGTLRALFSPRRARAYLSTAGVLLKDFKDWAQALTTRVSDAAKAAAQQAGRPYQYLVSPDTDKLGLAREIAARDCVQRGLVAVFSAVEPCTAVSVRGDRESGCLIPVVQRRKCLHLYHYLLHPTFGLCHVRVQTWLPFTVEVWINGREWLAQQMDAAGLAYVKRENFFPALADPNAAQALFDEQPRIDWPKQLGRLLDATHPLHPEMTAPLWGQSYYWSLAANARYLQALAATAPGRPLGQMAAPLTKPVRRQGKRHRALNPFAAKDAAVLALINRGEFTIEGLRNADVQSVLFSGPARTKKERRRRSAAAGRYLRLLRAHRLIGKVPGRHRYLITARGREAATALITAQQADVEKLTALAA